MAFASRSAMEVRQIRTRHHQNPACGRRPADRAGQLPTGPGILVAHDQRDKDKRAQSDLQEGKLNFEGMLLRVGGGIIDDHPGLGLQVARQFFINGNQAQRRFISPPPENRNAPEGNTVAGTDENHRLVLFCG